MKKKFKIGNIITSKIILLSNISQQSFDLTRTLGYISYGILLNLFAYRWIFSPVWAVKCSFFFITFVSEEGIYLFTFVIVSRSSRKWWFPEHEVRWSRKFPMLTFGIAFILLSIFWWLSLVFCSQLILLAWKLILERK